METVSTVESRGKFNSHHPASKHVKRWGGGNFQKAEGLDEHYFFNTFFIISNDTKKNILQCSSEARSRY